MNTINLVLTILGGGMTAIYYGGVWLDGRRDRQAMSAGDRAALATAKEEESVDAINDDVIVAPSVHDEVTSDGEEDDGEGDDEGEVEADPALPAEAEHATLAALAAPGRASDVIARVARATGERVRLTPAQADALLGRLKEEGLVEGREDVYALTGFGERVVGGGEGGLPS